MRRLEILIDPDPDGVRCGECRWNYGSAWCHLFDERCPSEGAYQPGRCQPCLDADRGPG